MLAVCGKLDLTMGGPSVQQFFFKDDHSPVYDYARFDVDDPRGLRRSVYRFLVRSVPDPFMECLDCADPSIMTPKRNTTLTVAPGLGPAEQPVRACGRPSTLPRGCDAHARATASADRSGLSPGARAASPTAEKRTPLVDYAEKHGLANACRVIFNSNEFVFVD